MTGIACWNPRMLSGPELGEAIANAMKEMHVNQKQVAKAFNVSQPSVSEWLKHGRVAKKHIPKLIDYFSKVVGPDYWGLPISKQEFDLVKAFRKLPEKAREDLLRKTEAAAAKTEAATAELIGDDAQPEAPHVGNEVAA